MKKIIKKDPSIFVAKKGFQHWHIYKTYGVENGFEITVSDTPGGCGASVLFGWYDKNRNNIDDIILILKKIQEDVKKSGVGCLFLQIGESYYKYSNNLNDALDKLEYQYIEYNNYRHGDDAKQRMYYKKL